MYRTLYALRCGPLCRQACSLSHCARGKTAHCCGRRAAGHWRRVPGIGEGKQANAVMAQRCIAFGRSSRLHSPKRFARSSSAPFRSGRKSNDVQGDLRAAACSGNNSVCLQPMTEVDPAFCRIELVWCRCECQLFNLLLATQ